MDTNVLVFVVVTSILWTSSYAATERHHDVIFDAALSPEMKSQAPPKIDVKIGEFLDISCPQYDMNDHSAVRFHIYDLDFEAYKKCDLEEKDDNIKRKKKKVFSCINPHRYNKLTIKFQRRSPNPYGFTFKEKETHYYVGVPVNDTDCKEAVVLKVYVKEDKKPIIPPIEPINKEEDLKSTTTSTTTTTPKTTRTSTLINKLTKTKAVTGRSSRREDGGRGSSPSTHIASLTSFFLPLITLLILMRLNT